MGGASSSDDKEHLHVVLPAFAWEMVAVVEVDRKGLCPSA